MSSRSASLVAAIAVACSFFALPAHADDPPTRVGRIAAVNGTVSFRPGPGEDWGNAVLNYPVAQSTAVWVDENSTAELEIGAAHVHLDAGTELDVTELDDQKVTLTVPQGRIDVTLNGSRPDEQYEISTSRGDVALVDGQYRVDAGTPQDPTRIATFTGNARLTGQGRDLRIGAGQEAVSDTADPPFYQVGPGALDPLDDGGTAQDAQRAAAPPPSYVPALPGAETLAQYGTWRMIPEYGHVWMPADVPAGWTPYSTGHWAWIPPWGWTWIDDAPWGFAPFHYGRWALIDGAWGWIPVDPDSGADPGEQPAYSPAMVAFADDPGDYAADWDGPCVGWIPLGPGEYWNPWYGASDFYFSQINIFNINRAHFVGHRPTHAQLHDFLNSHHMMLMRRDGFARGQSVHEAALRVRTDVARPVRAAVDSRAFLPQPTAAAGSAASPARGMRDRAWTMSRRRGPSDRERSADRG